MDAIALLALIFAVLVLVKLVVVAMSPDIWIKVTGPLLKNNTLTLSVYLGLAFIVGNFILQEISVIQVAAVFLLCSLLIGAGFVSYPKALFAIRREVGKESGAQILKQNWLTVLVWAGFALWVLFSILSG